MLIKNLEVVGSAAHAQLTHVDIAGYSQQHKDDRALFTGSSPMAGARDR